METKKIALLSVSDKSRLLPFAQALADMGWQLVASGGTARELSEQGMSVVAVSDLTHSPEILGGRVKTLHPTIHGGILARNIPTDLADLAAQQIDRIDLVVCNLYPFLKKVADPRVTVAEAVEEIDIGGVTLLRAAAKNFARVTAVCDPADYDTILLELAEGGEVSAATRQTLAVKAFAHTRDYDTAIAGYLTSLQPQEGFPPYIRIGIHQVQPLRYGENPHQKAALYASNPGSGPLGGKLLQGKELSYNNLLDLDAAWRAAESFAEPTVVIVKHLCPCGIATADSVAAAFAPALASDPVSAFGGVIAVNRTVDVDFIAEIEAAKLFTEAVIAPQFSDEAQAWFAAKKKNCRLVQIPLTPPSRLELRSIRGGFLVQDLDSGDPLSTELTVVSQRQPTPEEWAALRFAWHAAQHVKSNAIVFALPGATVGIGGGLPSRIDAVRLAGAKAGDRAPGSVMASDAFFPFADGIEAATEFGITAVIQPGGSIRDDLVIEAVDKLGLAMVFTGVRHFRH